MLKLSRDRSRLAGTSGIRLAAGALLVAGLLANSAGLAAANTDARRWVESFWPTARAAGVSQQVYYGALGDFTPDPEVIAKSQRQAEFVKPLWDYLDSAVSDWRIENGQKMLAEHGNLLASIENRYGVDRHLLVAIWGIESIYGRILDDRDSVKHTIRSLATLAYSGGRRSKFGRQQLVAALKILERGDITVDGMIGSWAGAMGHTQFIPTTYEAYAVDFDGNGRRDIWNSPADALGSAANYLARMGWESGKTWGYEVRFTPQFDFAHADDRSRSLAEWQRLGIVRAKDSPFPRPSDEATLYAPAGARGPAFLLLKNFRVIKRYNNADSYALAVGHLADRLAGFAPFAAEWPRDEKPLSEAERKELQQLLAQRGLYKAGIDGKIGSGSRAAIRTYQRSTGLIADGYASTNLLQHLRANR